MLGEKHDLLHELPEYKDRIHELEKTNPHFAHLSEKYHEADNEVRRIEQGEDMPSDEYTVQLKKRRLLLKDELLALIKDGA